MDHTFEQNCTVSYTVLGPNTRGPDHHYDIDVCASAEELRQFDREGYLVREGLFAGEDLKALQDALDRLEDRESGAFRDSGKAILGAYPAAFDGQRSGVFGFVEISACVIYRAGDDGATGQASGAERADQLSGCDASSDPLAPAFARGFQSFAAVVFQTPWDRCADLSG